MFARQIQIARAGVLTFLVLTGVRATDLTAHGQESPRWLTGRKLDQALAAPVGLGWPGNPLGTSLQRLSVNQRVAVFLDRRVDPQREVTLQVNRPLQEVFSYITAEHNTQHTQPDVRPRPAQRLAVSRLGDVIVIGPAASNAYLRTVVENRRQDVVKLPAPRKRNWLQTRPLNWPTGATPRDVLEKWSKQTSIRIKNLNQLPHDVWPAVNLPPLNSFEALSLILSNFDYTFRISGNGAQVALDVIKESDQRVEKLYSGGDDPQALAADISAAIPDAKIEFKGRQLAITARVEEHEWISGEREPGDSPVAGTQVHSLKVENQPIGAVIDYLAENLKFQVRWDEQAIAAAGISRDTLVSFEVVKQSLDKLLEEVLKPVGLVHKREGEIVRIFPAK
ncbi:MAG: hypothetical protein MPJ50_13360 [Pirellulales bacterium]|nr:hypothetical protein [Pirellulales bacterium]